ncbi:histidinol-phosphate transaminase [Lysobacter sp. HDW10]|uniref:histidinol-phosphate transaminase n=1 Tax=Lysobacter sp. HDW10 TaxID=2714936 RepID=UPI00140C2F5B|nr:histidinol-phosphate transaminase [Lysobacter sp. HDW10]QIK81847.1 histidinol-phosphate transaminase [Lysobacter sp. HDW10]
MSTAEILLREDLRAFGGYRSARSDVLDGDIWLNANESPSASLSDSSGTLRRYPDPQPSALREALSELYGVAPTQLLLTRGSDEGIDLLVRTFCAPGQGAVVIAPPVFGMYAVVAKLQGARVIEVPALDTPEGWRSDLDAMATAALSNDAPLVFICNPGNPSGECIALEDIAKLATRLASKALVVVDAAYAEFADEDACVSLVDTYDNLVLLRTLSKAHALAGARIGSVIAAPTLIGMLKRSQAPYPLAQPAVQAALDALTTRVLAATRDAVLVVRQQRTRLRDALLRFPCVRRVYPSHGNFLLVRFEDAESVLACLLGAGVIVRDMRATPGLEDALRISIGTAEQIDCVISALTQPRVQA